MISNQSGPSAEGLMPASFSRWGHEQLSLEPLKRLPLHSCARLLGGSMKPRLFLTVVLILSLLPSAMGGQQTPPAISQAPKDIAALIYSSRKEA